MHLEGYCGSAGCKQPAGGGLQDTQRFIAVGEGSSLLSKSGTTSSTQTSEGLLAAALQVCVCVLTPQFAPRIQHCFCLETQLTGAACCLLSSPAQGDGGDWAESSECGGHAPRFRPAFLKKLFLSPSTMPHS